MESEHKFASFIMFSFVFSVSYPNSYKEFHTSYLFLIRSNKE